MCCNTHRTLTTELSCRTLPSITTGAPLILWTCYKLFLFDTSFSFYQLYLFIYLASLGLSCDTQDLHCIMQDLLLPSTDLLVMACRLQHLHTHVLKHWTTREVPGSAKLLLHFWRVFRFIRHHDQILLYISSLIIPISQGNTPWL